VTSTDKVEGHDLNTTSHQLKSPHHNVFNVIATSTDKVEGHDLNTTYVQKLQWVSIHGMVNIIKVNIPQAMWFNFTPLI